MLQWCFAGDVTIMLPDLPYVTKPEQATFNSRGGRYYNSDWDFAIDVPANAIPEDQEVTVKMGACAYGPFDIPDNYHVASGFICIVANKPFLEAVNLTLEHCLVFSDYQEDSSVVVLRSDHSLVSGMKFKFFFTILQKYHPRLLIYLSWGSVHIVRCIKEWWRSLGQPQWSQTLTVPQWGQSTKQESWWLSIGHMFWSGMRHFQCKFGEKRDLSSTECNRSDSVGSSRVCCSFLWASIM